jgi:hypothetical protein
MDVVETIREKIIQLPPQAQEEVLRQVEQIEELYSHVEQDSNKNGDKTYKHPLTLIKEMAVEGLPSDFASRHDFYAHGKLED